MDICHRLQWLESGHCTRDEIDALLFGARYEILINDKVVELELQGLGRLRHVDRAIWACRKKLFGECHAGDFPPILLPPVAA